MIGDVPGEGGPCTSEDSGQAASKSAPKTSQHSSSYKPFGLVYSKTTQITAMNNDHVSDNEEVAGNASIHDVSDLSNDFGGTFMLDEELELEQKALKKNGPAKRYCIFYEDQGSHFTI